MDLMYSYVASAISFYLRLRLFVDDFGND